MSTPFYLAVDIRTDTTTAAIAESSGDGAIRVSGLTLGAGGTMPTAIYVGPDELYFGESALERGADDPERLIRDFLPGEGALDAAIVVAGEDFSRADLYAWTVDAVARRVAGERGSAPSGIWLVVPAVWTDAHLEAIADAFGRDGQVVDFIAAPEALAARYSQLDPADSDLTLVLCDLDDRALAISIERASARRGSRPLAAPIVAPVVRDGAADADLDRHAVDSIARGLQDAGIHVDQVDAIVLTGVSDRVSEFERLLIDRFGDPIGTDPQPALASAFGAALLLAREAAAAQTRASTPTAALATATSDPHTPTGVTHTPQPARAASASRWYRRPTGLVALGVGVLLAGAATVGGAYAIGGIGSPADEAQVTPAVTEVQVANDPADVPVPAAKPTTPAPAPAPAVPPAAEETDDSTPPVSTPRVPGATTPRTPATPSTPVTDPAPAPAPAQPAPPVVTPEPTPDPVPTTTPEPTPEPTEEPTPEPTEEPTPDPTPSETSSPTPPAEEAGSDTP